MTEAWLSPSIPTRSLELVPATHDALVDYGVLIGTDMPNAGLPIPFYRGSVIEGRSLPFVCDGRPVVRTAQVHPRGPDVAWLERHVRMTQIFVGLGAEPFAMVLGKPNHEAGLGVPDLDDLRVFVFPPGHGVMIARGTWHDFPMTLERPVTVLTMSSEDVVDVLATTRNAMELDERDVLKIDVRRRLGVRVVAEVARGPA